MDIPKKKSLLNIHIKGSNASRVVVFEYHVRLSGKGTGFSHCSQQFNRLKVIGKTAISSSNNMDTEIDIVNAANKRNYLGSRPWQSLEMLITLPNESESYHKCLQYLN